MRIIYVCENCGGMFSTPADWDAEKSFAEAERNFGSLTQDMACVCEDCYQRLMANLTGGWSPRGD